MRNFIIIFQIIVGIIPFIFLIYPGINLFDPFFVVVYTTNLLMLTFNTVTDFNIEIYKFKFTVKNTGSSIEINENLDKKEYRVITYGSSDVKKVEQLIDKMREGK